jgi:hypothetical protein
MKHLSEEELVEHYYQPGSAALKDAEFDRHIESCSECRSEYAALQRDLAAIQPLAAPEPVPDYGRQVWTALAPLLPPSAPKRARVINIGLWRGLSYAAACALLVVAAFFAGRAWENRQPRATAIKAPPPAQQHVVVVVVGDHLDRSERLLVELKHADADNAELISPLRDQARTLLAEDRAFRQDAAKTSDPVFATALDHLDILLTELANQPGGFDAAAVKRLQNEMNAEGLLFEVRVLRSRIPAHSPNGQAAAHGRSQGGTV